MARELVNKALNQDPHPEILPNGTIFSYRTLELGGEMGMAETWTFEEVENWSVESSPRHGLEGVEEGWQRKLGTSISISKASERV
jgi:hypothetical protein